MGERRWQATREADFFVLNARTHTTSIPSSRHATLHATERPIRFPDPFALTTLSMASQILPYVFISDADFATDDKEAIKALGIETIINCCSEMVDNEFQEDFTYVNLEMDDTSDCDAAQYFQQVYEVLKDVKDKQSKALIHCTNCKSMAPAIMTAYMLIASQKADKYLPLKKALDHVHSKRVGSLPDDNLLRQLVDLEVELYEEASIKVVRPGGGGGGRRGGKGRGGKGKRGK